MLPVECGQVAEKGLSPHKGEIDGVGIAGEPEPRDTHTDVRIHPGFKQERDETNIVERVASAEPELLAMKLDGVVDSVRRNRLRIARFEFGSREVPLDSLVLPPQLRPKLATKVGE